MFEDIKRYCNSLTRYSRYKTRVVNIGGVPMGGDYPIRIQSMTTTDTMDTKATVEQTIRMVEAGCEYVRITAPSINEAKNLEEIKKELRSRGYNVPLVADIHFTPNAAEFAARVVEKVRVNPGNYVDKKKFEFIEYDDKSYQEELERIRERFTPLVKICKEYGTVIRIGTNHGSLSDRIMSRYGDSPVGMVESALEFVRICEDNGFKDVVLSMKASNTQVMVQAYRLLIYKMEAEGMNYPLHLGVTEAGDGEDGRIKSAVGIGALLEDGIGDTIRVSLTEEPEFEAPVAIALANRYRDRADHRNIPEIETSPIDPFSYNRRVTNEGIGIGAGNVPRVFSDFRDEIISSPVQLEQIGYFYNAETDKWYMQDIAADFLYLGKGEIQFDIPNALRPVYDYSKWLTLENKVNAFPLYTPEEYRGNNENSAFFNFVIFDAAETGSDVLDLMREDRTIIPVIVTSNDHGMAEQRRFFFEMEKKGLRNPAIIKRDYPNLTFDQFQLYSATDFGALFIDGFGDGVWLTGEGISKKDVNRISFGILQAARVRISKTEYIACPSCGRTLFDLVETTNKIRKRTEHLKGVKIAIMGCIVNGPGEMADADYGYVGSGPGKITLYRGKDVVKRNVITEEAVDELIQLIREDDKWVEPVEIGDEKTE
ncbi:MAG: (E)-4-hydroxy-3-methylbut-2-enyl-diphosphate synthase [Ignavibacteriaceae bacterium]|nr:(E)-4-hydroxy-3-methylbut-2-enyl-diphosphate synthase [Ignavibacteriaceae bacterium]